MLMIARVHTGETEIHKDWSDEIVILHGSMTMTVGGAGKDMHATAPGELRGGPMEGGNDITLQAGDTIYIPAGTPHWSRVAPNETVSYVCYKVK